MEKNNLSLINQKFSGNIQIVHRVKISLTKKHKRRSSISFLVNLKEREIENKDKLNNIWKYFKGYYQRNSLYVKSFVD